MNNTKHPGEMPSDKVIGQITLTVNCHENGKVSCFVMHPDTETGIRAVQYDVVDNHLIDTRKNFENVLAQSKEDGNAPQQGISQSVLLVLNAVWGMLWHEHKRD